MSTLGSVAAWVGLLVGVAAVGLAIAGPPAIEHRLALGLLGISLVLATVPRVAHRSSSLVLAFSLLALLPMAGFVTVLTREHRQ